MMRLIILLITSNILRMFRWVGMNAARLLNPLTVKDGHRRCI
jgi:hypothetical protein